MDSCWAIDDEYNTIIFTEEAYQKLNIKCQHTEFHEHWFDIEKAMEAFPDAPVVSLK